MSLQQILAATGGSTPPLFDAFSTTHLGLWSLRLERSAYTGYAVRAGLAADSGATTLDIGFLPSGEFDMATYSAFGTGSERIITFYDQSGNGFDLSRAWDATLCPIIRTSSYNSKPAIYFSTGSLGNAGFTDWNGLAAANFYIVGRATGAVNGWGFDSVGDARWSAFNGGVATASSHFAPSGFTAYSTFNETARQTGYTYRFQFDGAGATNDLKARMYVNGTEFARAGGSGTHGTTLPDATGLYLNGNSTGTNALNQEYFAFYYLGYTLTAPQISQIQSSVNRSWFPFTSTGQLICLGDSLTVSVGSTAGQEYPTVLHGLLESDLSNTWQFVPVTAAMGGRDTAEAGAQVARVSQLNITDPAGAGNTTLYIDLNYYRNAIVVWCGTNDLAAGATGADTLTAIASLVASIKAINPTTLIVSNIIPRADAGLAPTFESERLIFNAGLAAAIGSNGIVCDLAGVPQLQDPNNTTYFNSFKVHLTDAGYAIVAQTVAATIEANL